LGKTRRGREKGEFLSDAACLTGRGRKGQLNLGQKAKAKMPGTACIRTKVFEDVSLGLVGQAGGPPQKTHTGTEKVKGGESYLNCGKARERDKRVDAL